VGLVLAAVALWQPGRPATTEPAPPAAAAAPAGPAAPFGTDSRGAPAAEPPAATAPGAIAGARGSAAPDLESPRSGAAPPPPAESVPGPGGLAVSIRNVESNYPVAPGDTLERIAQRFGTTVDAIVGINNLRDRNTLQVNQKLIIP
jgi:hypothetical protein